MRRLFIVSGVIAVLSAPGSGVSGETEAESPLIPSLLILAYDADVPDPDPIKTVSIARSVDFDLSTLQAMHGYTMTETQDTAEPPVPTPRPPGVSQTRTDNRPTRLASVGSISERRFERRADRSEYSRQERKRLSSPLSPIIGAFN